MTGLTWPDAKEMQDAIGLIPTGAVEQHGPHLPLATDCFIAEELARRIAESFDEQVVVAPMLPGGLSSHHLAFPGTVTLSEETFGAVLDAYVAAFERIGIRRIAHPLATAATSDFWAATRPPTPPRATAPG